MGSFDFEFSLVLDPSVHLVDLALELEIKPKLEY